MIDEQEPTFGGRPLFFGTEGVDDPVAVALGVPPGRLFLLPFGRPRPRFAGTSPSLAAASVNGNSGQTRMISKNHGMAWRGIRVKKDKGGKLTPFSIGARLLLVEFVEILLIFALFVRFTG